MTAEFAAPSTTAIPYGHGRRMLTIDQVAEWFNTEPRHIYKLVGRDAIPYRKVGHLLRFPETEVDDWSHPQPKPTPLRPVQAPTTATAKPRRSRARPVLPKSLIEWPADQGGEGIERKSA